MTTTTLPGHVALDRLWSGLRLVVIDVETTVRKGDKHRIVSIAAVTCRAGGIRGRWQTLVNPGVPISKHTTRIHGITDEHVAGEPAFPDIATAVLALLSAQPGERLVVVAHQVNFDIPVLRHELDLAGHPIPDLPVLDTMGRLPEIAGVRPDSRSLASLLDVLGLTNAAPHDALADAVATAEACLELLRRAADAGHDDIDALLSATGDGTTGSLRYAGPTLTSDAPARPVLPDDHVAGHARILGRSPTPRALTRWQEDVTACAALRCPYLADRVAGTPAPPDVLLTPLLAVLDDQIAAADVAGTATVLAAVGPLLPALPPVPGRSGLRRAALDFHDRYQPQLAALGRCADDDPCPSCRIGDPCPLDTWPDCLAVAALGGPLTADLARGFFETTGKEAGTGPWAVWRAHAKTDRTRLADAALRHVHDYWRATGQDGRASTLARMSWNLGAREPNLAAAHASALSAGGRDVDLAAAHDVSQQALATRGGSTADGWPELAAMTAYLDGRINRSRVRYSDQFDADGNPVPIRRHHPDNPRRTRPARFLRTTNSE